MDDNPKKPIKRRNKFVGKEDISRETADNILSAQIDRFRKVSRMNDETASQVRESVNILYEKLYPRVSKLERESRVLVSAIRGSETKGINKSKCFIRGISLIHK